MITPRLYFDHNATAPIRDEARSALVAALDLCGSASSVHADGRAARRLVEEARHRVAQAVGALAKNVIFCASATEANNLALSAGWQRGSQPLVQRMAVSAIEHASVLKGVHFSTGNVSILPADSDGMVLLDGLKEVLEGWRAEGVTGLVSLMLANNETGVIQPVAEIAALVHEAGSLLHCDAAQAFGKIPFSIRDIGADLVTLSSHKIGGAPGVGALVLASDALHNPHPLVGGGGQERGLRAGTENVPGIAGFGAAASAAALEIQDYGISVNDLRSRLEVLLSAESSELVIFGQGSPRLPNTICFADPGIAAETMLIALDLEGISVSSGSACSSGKVRTSHVLLAMGVEPDLADCALRISLGRNISLEQIQVFAEVWTRLRKGLHDRKRNRAA